MEFSQTGAKRCTSDNMERQDERGMSPIRFKNRGYNMSVLKTAILFLLGLSVASCLFQAGNAQIWNTLETVPKPNSQSTDTKLDKPTFGQTFKHQISRVDRDTGLTIDGGTPNLLNGTNIDLKKTIPTANPIYLVITKQVQIYQKLISRPKSIR